jgi:hypothetical protein
MFTGQSNKEQVSQDLKDGFLIYLLITRLLMLILRILTQKIVNKLTNFAFLFQAPLVTDDDSTGAPTFHMG